MALIPVLCGLKDRVLVPHVELTIGLNGHARLEWALQSKCRLARRPDEVLQCQVDGVERCVAVYPTAELRETTGPREGSLKIQ